MRFTREQVLLCLGAPTMVGGLVAVALAQGWPMRLGGAAMVLGAAAVLGSSRDRARRIGWTLAGLGAVAVLIGWR
jgi:hypothetical protein